MLPTEKHPFKTYIPQDCSFLLVGSFPPIKLTEKLLDNIRDESMSIYYEKYEENKRNRLTKDDIKFYYGSRDNLFWHKVISELFDITFSSKDDIMNFLNKWNIGITDIVENTSRRVTKDTLSSKDSDLIIQTYRDLDTILKENAIRTIFTTSSFVSNYILNSISLNNTELITLPSPSKLASRGIGRDEEYKKMKKDKVVSNTIEYRIFKYNLLFKNKIMLNPKE